MCNCDMSPYEKLTLISLNGFVGKAIVPAKDQDTLSATTRLHRKIVAPFGPRVRVIESASSKARLNAKPRGDNIVFPDSDRDLHWCIARTEWGSVEQYAVCSGCLNSS